LTTSHDEELELPENLSVLFVDDDQVLRKLFARSLRRAVGPSWKLREAANGETALHLVESNDFDIIFLDQYMASVNKQLLGTETARALRAKGVRSKICGLSANDVRNQFLEAGANAFMFKPFPCEPSALRKVLIRLVHGWSDLGQSGLESSGVAPEDEEAKNPET
jgi:CheY-like chemotaxis protein